MHAIVIHHDHEQVDRLPAQLKSPIAAGNGDWGNAAPLSVV
jgi:hypothetical protein